MDSEGVARRHRRILGALLVYGAMAIIVVHEFLFTISSMSSGSMAPTLISNAPSPDRVLIDRLTQRLRSPVRGEIVHFVDREGAWVLKRVVGLPGERVSIVSGRVNVNGAPLRTPAQVANRRYENAGYLQPGKEMTIDAGYVLVLGDDTKDSYDSRYWGCLSENAIGGIARAVIWPPSRVSSLVPDR